MNEEKYTTEQRDLTLSKKILFSMIIVVSVFLALELSVRVYHAVKFREKAYFFYGDKFVRNLINGLGKKKLAEKYGPDKASKAADYAFLNRDKFPLYSDYDKHFRSWDYAIDKAPDTARVICIGASFVHGVALDDRETWPYLLGEKLNEDSRGKRYEVMSCSVMGSNINILLAELTRYAVKLKPDYLIVFSAYNNHHLIKMGYDVSPAWKLGHFFYNISRLYSTVRDKMALILSKDIYYFHENWGVVVSEERTERAFRLYRKRLEQIVTVCRENEIKPILCMQPMFLPENLKNLQDLTNEKELERLEGKIKTKGRLSHYEFKYYMQGRFNLEMKRISESEGLLLFDGVSVFPKDRHMYYIDAIHLNREGTAILAKELFSFCVQNNILKQ